MAKIIVGIDFGTSTTVVRWRKEDSDEIHVINGGDGQSKVIDSAIFIPNGNDNWIFGKQALNYEYRQGQIVRNFKMDLINPDTNNDARLYIRRFMEYVYSLFIKEIQHEGINYDSIDFHVSYPVKWSKGNKMLMKEIISNVGFGQLGAIIGKTEPEAAAIEMMRIHIPHLTKTGILRANFPLNVMMLDMGAGTSDLFIFQLTISSNGEIIIPEDKIFQYPVSEQPYNCGGREIDELLSRDVLDYLSKGFGNPVNERFFDIKKAKEWKDSILSDVLMQCDVAEIPSHLSPTIELAEQSGQWNKALGKYKMSRNKFENITETHWMNLYRLIENGIAKSKQECKIGAEDVDLIFLTGGHSQWYCVPNLFNGKGINGTIGVKSTKHNILNFSKIIDNEWKILRGTNPQEIVARGLCWPKTINIPSKAENNVWIRFGVNGVYSEYKQIVFKGEMLPYKTAIINGKSETKFNHITITQNMITDPDVFDVEFNILEGENIDNSAKSIFSYLIDENSVGAKIILAILGFGLPLFTNQDYNLSYTADIGVSKDGTLSLSGKLYLDGEEKVCFTEKDFKIL